MKTLPFLLWCAALHSATLYVDPAGSDSNPGTLDRPLATISRAVKRVSAGDTIVLRDGVYGPEGLNAGFPVWITKSGSPASWITLKAENRGRAILDCQNDQSGSRTGCDGYIYFHTGAAYWVLQDLVFRHGFSFGASSNSTPGAHDILVRGCAFEFIGQHPSSSVYGEVGFYVGEASWNFTFDGNVFHDIGRTSGLYLSNDQGLYLHSSAATIMNNVFYPPISGWGIQTAKGFSGLIANNTFALPLLNNNGQLMLWDVNGGVTVVNNIFYNPRGAIAINTSSLTMSNGCTIDHNLVAGGVIGFVTACSFGTNFSGDPGFVNAVTPPYDFHVSASSPAIGMGVPVAAVTIDLDGVRRPNGSAYTLGAYEYVPPAQAPLQQSRQAPPGAIRRTKIRRVPSGER